MLQTYVSGVLDVSKVCCKCFVSVKVDRDVSHVAMAMHVCFKSMFQMFRICCKCFNLDVAKVDLDVAYICMLQTYVSSVLYTYCKCFIWMLHMFVMVFTCFCKCFGHMFQVFHLSSFVCCNCCIYIF
jgi:hypothetical protein